MFISRHTLKWTKTCRSSGDFPHAHTAHFLLNRHRYSAQRLENACSLALQSVASPRYAHIGPILESGQDIAGEIPDDAGDHGADGGDDGAGWVRGGDYYANMGR